MTPLRLIGASVLLAAAATSQVNAFVFYPQDPERQTITCTSFVGRPDGNNQAEAMMEVSTEHFRGVGDANGLTYIFGAYHWIADEKLSTSETYSIVVRKQLATGPGPNMDATAELLRLGGLTTPPSTNPGRGTWITYEGFGPQAPLNALPPGGLPAEGRYYVGVDLPANPLWPATDGHSLFRADLLSANTSAAFGENERLGAPDPTWGGSVGGTAYSTPWTYILGPLVTSPNLHVGGVDPQSNRLGAAGASYAMNGLYPDIMGTPRCDGLMFRITDSLAPNGVVFMAAQFGFRPPIFVWNLFPNLIGHAHLGATAVPLGVTVLTNGAVEVNVAFPNTIPPVMIGSDVAFQSIVVDTAINLGNWSNAQAVHL
ncbi:MAG: hypothetical protein ACI85K_002455 [Hyphomicrobiaceae bacterium]|jgi:hypothetical protein